MKNLKGFALKNKNIFYYFLKTSFPEQKIFDVGCGNGAFLKAIYDKGYKNIFGADIADFIGDQKLKEIINFKKTDANFDKFSWPDNFFDAITAFALIEHLENPFFFIKETERLLKPEGLLVISIPNAFHIWSRLKFLLKGDLTHWTLKNEHISIFTKAIFKKTFRNYKIEKVFYSAGFIPYFPKIKLPPLELFSGRTCFFMRKI